MPRSQLPDYAIFNYDIIEWDACAILWICLITVAAVLAAFNQYHQVHKPYQELLIEIATKGLTTIHLPYILRVRQ